MINMLNKISDHEIKSELDQSLPNTQSQLIGVYSMGVKIFNLPYLIGTCINLPNYILKSKYIMIQSKIIYVFGRVVHSCMDVDEINI